MDDAQYEVKSRSIAANTLLHERYLIQEKIAIGGMGNIYRAIDLDNENFPLAIKVLHKSYQNDQQYVARFRREVALASQISHPNVVKIFDLVESKENIFFTMEFIHGFSLEEELETIEYSEDQIARLIIEVADGLKAIHALDIVHRDIKPGNIMQQPDGSHKIIDFGISRPHKSRLTKKNIRVGSIFYIAPELWLGKKASKRSDFYSLGCMLYELWGKELPYQTDNPLELMKMHCYEPIPNLPNLAPHWLQSLIQKLMAKDPADRPENSQEIIDFVQAECVSSQSIQVFDHHMESQTIRSGAAMMSVFNSLNRQKEEVKDQKQDNQDQRKALMFSLKSTRPEYLETTFNKIKQKKRGKTLVFKLPRNAAIIFEFELPSRDFLYLGIFLASLNLFDWYLTGQGVSTHGIMSEGNHFMKSLMLKYGVDQALLYTKGIAILIVFVLTILARKSRMVKDLVGFLSIIYLLAAVIPWIYILYYR